MLRRYVGVFALACLTAAASALAAQPDEGRTKAEAALSNIGELERPGEIGLATIFDGNKYVQCRRNADHLLLCEAAGSAMQPTLARVLTPDRIGRLLTLGWHPDASFGNFVQLFPANLSVHDVAAQLVQTLGDGYDADLNHLEVRSAWVTADPCPPRNGPRQNLAGSINDATSMAGLTIHACSYTPPVPQATIRSADDLIGVYGARVTGEVGRLIVNSDDRSIHLILDIDDGYVQCAPDRAPAQIFCEAASADSLPTLEAVLTSDRVARLHALGFADPGRGPNYAKSYPLPGAEAGTIARELLVILYDVYGYRGRPKLSILTEKSG